MNLDDLWPDLHLLLFILVHSIIPPRLGAVSFFFILLTSLQLRRSVQEAQIGVFSTVVVPLSTQFHFYLPEMRQLRETMRPRGLQRGPHSLVNCTICSFMFIEKEGTLTCIISNSPNKLLANFPNLDCNQGFAARKAVGFEKKRLLSTAILALVLS